MAPVGRTFGGRPDQPQSFRAVEFERFEARACIQNSSIRWAESREFMATMGQPGIRPGAVLRRIVKSERAG